MIETVTRRSIGMLGIITAPTIVRVASLMPVPRKRIYEATRIVPWYVEEIIELLTQTSDMPIVDTKMLLSMWHMSKQDPRQALPKFRHNPVPNFSGRPIKGDDI